MQKLLTLLIICITINAKADSWVQKASYLGIGSRFNLSFAIGNKGYVGCGFDTTIVGNTHNDFWEYDPSTNVWTQKANVGGAPRGNCVGFSIGNKGYAGLGFQQFCCALNDFWEYDPNNNIWVIKANFSGGLREDPVGFSIGNMGYVAMGEDNSGNLYNDIWQYNPANDTWVQKTSCPGSVRTRASSFVIGTDAYIICGAWFLNDVWQYNSITDTWSQKGNFPIPDNYWAAAFSICGLGYCGTGIAGGFTSDWWQYNPVTDIWTQKTNLPGSGRDGCAFFSIGTKGYIGLGVGGFFHTDFYEYTPDSACTTGIADIAAEHFDFTIYPNPAKGEFTVYGLQFTVNKTVEIKVFDTKGKMVLSKRIANSNYKPETVNCKQFPTGIYYVQVSEGENKVARKVVVE